MLGSRCLLALALSISVGCGDDDGGDTDGGAGDGGSSCAVTCDDGLFCNGLEVCNPASANADSDGCVAGNPPCDEGMCNEDSSMCIEEDCPDADGDGASDVACGGDDCDDDDPTRFPGATEVCDVDNVDEDCDSTTFGDTDDDDDGRISSACCNGETCGNDCDDSNSAVYGGLVETCDSIDNDCDGMVDETVLLTFYPDTDGDGFGDPMGTTMQGCSPPAGFVADNTDCDDATAARNPSAPEVCDAYADNDCDPSTHPFDMDDDGHDRFDAAGCPGGTDCDDSEATVYPGAPELCDRLANDCSNLMAPEDQDEDGFLAPGTVCSGGPLDSAPLTDCDDSRGNVNPDATEICDGSMLDEDCDGTANPPSQCSCTNDSTRPCPSPGICGAGTQTCTAGTWGACSVTAQMETCNGLDDDCDSVVDNEPTATSSCAAEPQATIICGAMGTCDIDECDLGFEDCNDDPGCETDITTTTNCRSCGNVCIPGASCGAMFCQPFFEFLWAAPGELASNGDNTLAIHRDGDTIFAAGHHRGADLDETGPATAAPGGVNPFLVALNDSGGPLWANALLGRGEIMDIATIGTDVIVVGGGGSPIMFDDTTTAGHASGESAFVASYAQDDGSLNWVQILGGSGGFAAATGLEIDGTRIFVSGRNGTSGDYAGMTVTGSGAFLMELNASGVAQWVTMSTSGSNAGFEDLTWVPGSSRVCATGYANGSVTFAGQSFTTNSKDVFLACLSDAGAYAWHDVYGSDLATGGNGEPDFGSGLATDGTNVYMTALLGFNSDIGDASLPTGAVIGAYAVADGAHVWSRSLQAFATSFFARRVAHVAAGNGSVYVIGNDNSPADYPGLPGTGALLGSLDPATGADEWMVLLGPSAVGSVVEVTSDGLAVGGRFGSANFGEGLVNGGTNSSAFVAHFAALP